MISLRHSFARPLIVLSCFTLFGCKPAEPNVTTNAPSPTASESSAEGSTIARAVEPAKVKGRWLRPDGGYILEIGAIAEDGRAEAKYFNPSPIHIAWARVKSEGGALKVDAELRDVNYPGCLYKLTYVPEKDQLVGTYFQAQMQQTHEIEFVRAP